MSQASWTGLAAALAEGDRYRPLQRLGKKSGRQTLLCEDCATGKQVVIKLLTFGEDFAWDDLKLFEREAEVLQSLDHPAIPKYLDYFELETPTSKGFALVQSYIEARSLGEQLRAGRSFSETEIRQIGEELLQILDYLHRRQPPVIHRDIKPSNILLGDRTAHSPGKVYLVDFGSVQTLFAREGGTITVVGTYGYMPPEQFGGRAVPASDLYSLGATLIFLASGQHPADLPQEDFRIQFEKRVQLSPAVTSWLRQLAEPRLEKRVSSAEEAIAILKQSTQGKDKLIQLSEPNSSLIPDRPRSSRIKSQYDANHRLVLSFPPNQLQLRRVENNGYALGCLIFLFVLFLLFLLTGLLILIGSSNDPGSMGLLVTILSIILTLTFFIFGPGSSNNGRTHITFEAGYLLIQRPHCFAVKLNQNQIWKIKRYSSQLALCIGKKQLTLQGHKADLDWLEKIFRDELNLPAE